MDSSQLDLLTLRYHRMNDAVTLTSILSRSVCVSDVELVTPAWRSEDKRALEAFLCAMKLLVVSQSQRCVIIVCVFVLL